MGVAWRGDCPQIDADELWTTSQLQRANAFFVNNPRTRCAYTHCHFFIAPDLLTVTPGGYSHNDGCVVVWRTHSLVPHT